MMSSVIPARLEFQCGHAALVSLPRVKGESSAERNDRIAREKSAAQSRSCDFCPPMAVVEVTEAVVVVAAQPAPPAPPVELPVRVVVAAPVPVVAAPVPVVAAPVPVVAAPVSVVVPAEPAVVALPEPAVVAAPVPVVVVPAEPAVVARPVPAVVAARTAPPVPTTTRVGRPRRTPVPAATTYRFVVRFHAEAVFAATDIRDALRQAESLGATELLAVTQTG